MITKKHFVLLCLLCSKVMLSQIVSDTLEGKNDVYLRNKTVANLSKDKPISKIYASYLLSRAKKLGDQEKIAFGYHLLSLSSNEKLSNIYLDSIITFSKGKNLKRYPEAAYMLKGGYYYKKREFKKTLDWFLKADSLLQQKKDDGLLSTTKRTIGILKGRIGEHEEALEELKVAFDYFERTEKWNDYNTTAFAIVESYNFLRKADSAQKYIELGIKKTREISSDFEQYFILASSGTRYNQELYQASIDSTNKCYNFFLKKKDLPNVAFAHYYRGKSLEALGKKEMAIANYKSIDSVFTELGDIHPGLRDSWEKVIDYYDNKEDVENEIKYIKQLLKVDSILNDNYRYLNNNISKKYDVPQLLVLKNNLIEEYETSNERFSNRNTWLIFGIIALVVLFIIYRIWERKRIKKFKEIIQHLENRPKRRSEPSIGELPLSIQLYEKITQQLIKLEGENYFLDNSVTLTSTAKNIGTNNKYLSMYINHAKKENFTQYINNLRISYTLQQLNSGSPFINYSLNAVASEVGFNSTEYFSKAFKRKTGMSPSYFIKQLLIKRNS